MALLALGATYVVVRLRSEANLACDLGINSGAATGGVLGSGLLMLLLDLAGISLARLVPHRGVAALLVVALLASTSWLFLATTGPPEGYPSPIDSCVENIPAWWPSWLPS